MTPQVWQTSRFSIDLTHPKVMAIVNLTPDSFSEGGQNSALHQALDQAQKFLAQGADILDIGGESTRPGAKPVNLAEELARVLPFLKEAVRWQVPISVDTYKPEVMQLALDSGVDIINDVWALRQPGALKVVSQHSSCGVCLMHMHREPSTMQDHPMVGDAVVVVKNFLAQQLVQVKSQGVDANRIVVDPGIGFGKTTSQNIDLLSRQAELLTLGHPLLAGWSRKGSLGKLSAIQGVEPEPQQRLGASLSAAILAVQRGASLVRVHDVQETVQALRVWKAVQSHAV
jgi:dihydropteroate synthase